MIKKYILGLFTFFIGLGIATSVNAVGVTTTVGIDSFASPVNSNYSITALKGGGFLSNYLGVGKSVLALDNQRLFRRTTNGYPYAYLQSANGTTEGFFDRYYSCDLMTGNELTGCTASNINYSGTTADFDKTVMKSFFTTVKQGDTFYVNSEDYRYIGATWSYTLNYIRVCWNSEEIGKAFCFMGGICTPGNDTYCKYLGNLINSQNLQNQFNGGLTYGLLNNSRIGYAPGQGAYEGGNNTNSNTVINQQCPTIRQLMNNYGQNYNTGLCYNNTLYFNGQTMETIEKQDIFTIFNNDYDNYTNRISIYRNNCGNTNTTQACQNAFSGEYKKYSIIANASNSSVDEKRLWNYCNMGLNYDPNATTCVSSGYLAEQPTAEERLNDLINMNTGIPTPQTAEQGKDNNVFNTLCDPDDPTNCYGSGNVRDIFGSLENIYGKITGIFKQRSGVNGIIPDYILWITMLTLVFTILLKK